MSLGPGHQRRPGMKRFKFVFYRSTLRRDASSSHPFLHAVLLLAPVLWQHQQRCINAVQKYQTSKRVYTFVDEQGNIYFTLACSARKSA